MNVDNLGTADSEPFARYRIPRITLHSVTEQELVDPAFAARPDGSDQDERLLRQLPADRGVSGVSR
jgi:hypothetical protein